MKKIIFAILSRQSHHLSPAAVRKLKTLFFAATLVVLTAGALAVWAGVSLARYASVEIATGLEAARPQITNWEQTLEKVDITKVNLYGCWSKAQALLTPAPWMTTTVATNLAQLKSACMTSVKNDCVSGSCRPDSSKENPTVEVQI